MEPSMQIFQQQSACAKTQYGHCDSYFVESHGEQERWRRRHEMLEREKYVKRERQSKMAQDLSNIASYELRDDHLREMEKMEMETLPDVASIDIQTEIKWYMRPYLLDFLIEAHAAFGLLPETLFLTVNLLDRYCSKRIVYKKHYQLVGCAALLIASKYGDRKERVPTIKELKNMCCSLYEDDMFLQMEWHVLQTLNWVIGHPTIDAFLQMATEHQPFHGQVENMARYIAEIALFQREFVAKRPSDMARSALALARCILGLPQEHYSAWAGQFDSHTLMSLAQQLHRPSVILSRKYASAHLCRVSTLLEEFLVRSEEENQMREQAPANDRDTRMAPPGTEPMTPSKPPVPTCYNHGCPTPPDTPTEEANFPNQQRPTNVGGFHHQHLLVGPQYPPSPPTPPGFDHVIGHAVADYRGPAPMDHLAPMIY